MSNVALGLLSLLAVAVAAVAYLLILNEIANAQAPRDRGPHLWK